MASFLFLNQNKRYPHYGVPGDRGCVVCGKLAKDTDPDAIYVVDERDRYWCLAHAGAALADIRRAIDERTHDMYRWTFQHPPTALSTTRDTYEPGALPISGCDHRKIATAIREAFSWTGEEPFGHRPDGTPITNVQMMAMLEAHDPDAESFVEDVIQTSIRLVRGRRAPDPVRTLQPRELMEKMGFERAAECRTVDRAAIEPDLPPREQPTEPIKLRTRVERDAELRLATWVRDQRHAVEGLSGREVLAWLAGEIENEAFDARKP